MNSRKPAHDPVARLALSPDEAAVVLGLGRSSLYLLLRSKELASFKVGRRRLISIQALDEFLARRQATEA